MTETHKAAVEALEAALKSMPKTWWNNDTEEQEGYTKEITQWFFDNEKPLKLALRTLKQPSSVEVTEVSVNQAVDAISCALMGKYVLSEYVYLCVAEAIPKAFPNGLRITRAAATDGVKS